RKRPPYCATVAGDSFLYSSSSGGALSSLSLVTYAGVAKYSPSALGLGRPHLDAELLLANEHQHRGIALGKAHLCSAIERRLGARADERLRPRVSRGPRRE